LYLNVCPAKHVFSNTSGTMLIVKVYVSKDCLFLLFWTLFGSRIRSFVTANTYEEHANLFIGFLAYAEQTRGRCPRIHALANIGIALYWRWEDLSDVTRILLATMADSLSWQGAKMDDTITLITRILLATKGFYSVVLIHGGSSGGEDAR